MFAMFMPLWSTLVFCPIVMYLARPSVDEKDKEGKTEGESV
jgi:hypothetical protein